MNTNDQQQQIPPATAGHYTAAEDTLSDGSKVWNVYRDGEAIAHPATMREAVEMASLLSHGCSLVAAKAAIEISCHAIGDVNRMAAIIDMHIWNSGAIVGDTKTITVTVVSRGRVQIREYIDGEMMRGADEWIVNPDDEPDRWRYAHTLWGWRYAHTLWGCGNVEFAPSPWHWQAIEKLRDSFVCPADDVK